MWHNTLQLPSLLMKSVLLQSFHTLATQEKLAGKSGSAADAQWVEVQKRLSGPQGKVPEWTPQLAAQVGAASALLACPGSSLRHVAPCHTAVTLLVLAG